MMKTLLRNWEIDEVFNDMNLTIVSKEECEHKPTEFSAKEYLESLKNTSESPKTVDTPKDKKDICKLVINNYNIPFIFMILLSILDDFCNDFDISRFSFGLLLLLSLYCMCIGCYKFYRGEYTKNDTKDNINYNKIFWRLYWEKNKNI